MKMRMVMRKEKEWNESEGVGEEEGVEERCCQQLKIKMELRGQTLKKMVKLEFLT